MTSDNASPENLINNEMKPDSLGLLSQDSFQNSDPALELVDNGQARFGMDGFTFEAEENIDSINDFFKELEEKEKALHISTDAVFEIEAEDADFARSEEDEIEKLLRSYETKKPAGTQAGTSPQHTHSSNTMSFSELEAEVTRLKNDVAKASAEKLEIQESFRRRQTDFENFRKRTDRERGEIFRSVLSSLAMKILPVVDNLNRAIVSSDALASENITDYQNLIDGVRMVDYQLISVLEEMGIEPILSIGETFDPNFHEAVEAIPNDTLPHNTVVEELIKGYRIDDKVIRAAMVRVSTSNFLSTPSSNSQED